MNILKINGQALEGIYVDAAISFNKPAKRVSTYSVPGRNGDLVIDEGTFDNVLITYPVFEKDTFPTEFDEIVNKLAALEGYQRIECSNDPQHYRLGRFVVPQNPTAKRLNRDGYWQLSFDCKPQRWLLSGEEDTEIDANPIDEYSGDIVSFDAVALDEITELKAAIEPIQNLNGYDNPWPAGGGKNLYDDTTIIHGSFTTASVTTNSNEAYRTVKLTLPAGTYTFSCDLENCFIVRGVWDGTVHAINWAATRYTFTSTEEGTVAFCIRNTSSSTITDTVHAQVEIGSTATAYAPYSNICPISGHTEVNVYRAGKNLFAYSTTGSVTSNGITFTVNEDKTVTANGTATADAYIELTDYKYFNGDFIYSGNPSGSSASTYRTQLRFRHSGVWGAWFYSNGEETAASTTDADGFRLRLEVRSGQTVSNLVFKPMLRLATETDATYEPYTGQTYNVPLGQTVYGGTLDVVNGVLTIDMISVDMGDLSWIKTSNYYEYRANYSTSNIPNGLYIDDATVSKVLCGAYSAESPSHTYRGNYQGISLSANYISVGDKISAYPSPEAFKTAMSGVQIAYELATPTTVQLTPTQVSTLLGANNIWADTGIVEVKVTTPTVFNNPSLFNSKPLIRVYGVGTFRVNDITVTIASHDKPYIDIDCELQECFYEGENMNEYVSFSGNDFPELQPGDNYMLLASGITKLEVTPRWWIL